MTAQGSDRSSLDGRVAVAEPTYSWPMPHKPITVPVSTQHNRPAPRRSHTTTGTPGCGAELARYRDRLLGLGLEMRCQPRLHVLEVLGQVGGQRLSHRGRTPRLSRFDQRKMPSIGLVKCNGPSVIHESDVSVGDTDESLHDPRRVRPCGRAQENLVKLVMGVGVPQVAAVRIGDSQLLARARGTFQLLVGVVARRTPGKVRFDQQSEPVHLRQLFDAERGDDCSAPRAQHDQAVGLKPPKRLPDRDMADVHLLRQFPDRELLARTQAAGDNRTLDFPDNPLDERWCGLGA